MRKESTQGDHQQGVEPRTEIYHQLYAVRYLLDGEWTLAVLCALADGPKRYCEILDKVQSYHRVDRWSNGHTTLHHSSLTRVLDQLTKDELLRRHEKPKSFPPSVTYALTEPASTVLEAASPVAEWAEQHAGLIARAQARRRA